jgi:pyruvate formate lyase activating enzyme
MNMELASHRYENRTWYPAGGGKVQCMTCSRKCLIPNGKSGFCGIRKNVKGKLMMLSYGRAIVAHVDPVEKKPLYHFLPGSSIYSIGLKVCILCSNISLV